jgi:hypothetical protein
MYLSLDEACTHVDASAFRLVAGIYNRQGTRLLATSVSPPIRVLANNDVPTGAARIPLEACLPADWEGWGAEEAAMALPDVPRAERDADGRRKVTVRSLAFASSACCTLSTVAAAVAVAATRLRKLARGTLACMHLLI